MEEASETQKLIDRRLELKYQIERLSNELKEIDQEIKEEFSPGEVMLGSTGVGYKLHSQQSFEYGALTFQHLKERDLLAPFVKISTTGLEKLAKEGHLSWAELDKLRSQARVKETLVLRDFVPEEAKVIA